MYPGVSFIHQQAEHFKVKIAGSAWQCRGAGQRASWGLSSVHAHPLPPPPCAPAGTHTCIPWARFPAPTAVCTFRDAHVRSLGTRPPPMCTCRDAHVRSLGTRPPMCTCRDAHVRAPERLAKRVSRGSQSPPGVEPTRNSSPGERWWFPARKATGHETRPSTTQNLTRWGCQIQRDKTSRTLN